MTDDTSPSLVMVAGIGGPVPLAHWTWRDQKGNDWLPQDMETKHLFFTVRAVWNAIMDPDMRVGENINVWNFERPIEYMRAAVAILGSALIQRKDLEPWQKRDMMHMVANFIKNGWMEAEQARLMLPPLSLDDMIPFPDHALPSLHDERDLDHGQWGDR